ncbi:hypothetical protein [Actinophytocola xanthii]|uniref:Uncharacterized protein n=1 Tax=Actinophytocola xanthii TaxID=1912961 RepID=A0A1Q8CST8_9PSEU|nr:hypothetical protein [Actinophytocola xanthii]OLF17406.1 hypothetical protein BU204_11565 [Actinophytocola xanthii]
MKHGSLPRSIALPTEPTDVTYSPDGLSERAIDRMITETGVELPPVDDIELAAALAAPVTEVPLPSSPRPRDEAA